MARGRRLRIQAWDGVSGLGLRDPHKSKMRWEEGSGCGGQTTPAGTRQGERKNHRGGAGPVGRLQRGRRPCKKGRGWRLRGAGDTSAGSGSPGLPVGGAQENPAAPPGSASGQEAKSPVRGTGHCRSPGLGPPSSQGTGHSSPSAWAGHPHLHAGPEVQWGEPIHCSDPVLSFQFKATNTPHVLPS